MRCPKCGYISFDHMETCLKCKKDISGSTGVEGTTYHAAAPSFLRVPKKNAPEPDPVDEDSGTISMSEDFAENDYDFSDPDLDVLVAGDDSDGTVALDGQESDNDFLLEPDDDGDEEGAFDFGLDDEELDFSEDEPLAEAVFEVPDALTDISDLAPPLEDGGRVASVSSTSSAMSLSLDDEMSLDEDLDLDGLDLNLGLSSSGGGNDELSLSLDDIDLTPGDIVEEDPDLDELSLDLDLDAVPAPRKEKSSGSLDGISLSLD